MKIFTRKNAIVGFVTLKALEQRRKRKRRNTLKIGAYVALGLVSAGLLAALVALAVRRQRAGTEPSHLEGFAVSEAIEDAEGSELVELEAEAAEPGFAA